MQDDLDRVLPQDIISRARTTPDGTEYVIPYADVLEAVQIATEHAIAVLGVEVFQIIGDGLLAQEYSTYEFSLGDDWEAFVRLNNVQARDFVEHHARGEEHGYILTSTSKHEFADLR